MISCPVSRPVVNSQKLTTQPTLRYFCWSKAGVYLGDCWGSSTTEAREKFAAIRDLPPFSFVVRSAGTFKSTQV